MKWADAQQFVQRVQSEHATEITGGQNRLLTVIGVAMVIAGLALSIGIPVAILSGGFFPLAVVNLLGDAVAYFILLGLAMTAGGAIGLWNMKKQKK